MIKEFHESKNLFDGTYTKGFIGTTYIFKNTGTSANCAIISVSPNTTYTVTKYDESNRFAIGTSNVLPYDEIQLTGIYYVDTATAYTFTTDSFAHYMVVYVSTGTEQAEPRLMINVGSTALPYEPYGDTWNTKSYAKIVDTTQQVTVFPTVVRPMENAIPSWTIKGNMVQDGTPTPTTPIQPQECGDLSINLTPNQKITSNVYSYTTTTHPLINALKNITPNENYTLSWEYSSNGSGGVENQIRLYVSASGTMLKIIQSGVSFTLNSAAIEQLGALFCYFGATNTDGYMDKFMLVKGSKAKDYEPYGQYKIPISSASTTTPIYLGEVESTRQIKKLVLTGQETWYSRSGSPANIFFIEFQNRNAVDNTAICSHYINQDTGIPDDLQDKHILVRLSSTDNKFFILIRDSTYSTAYGFQTYLQQQYANGTPVCVWYVLANETISVVNEPLRKIGTYSDSVSGTNLSVTAQSPTTIDVDTSLKPSEMDLTYTGLKMCGRKKYAGLLADNPLCGISTYKDTLNLATGACTRYVEKYEFTGEESISDIGDYYNTNVSVLSIAWSATISTTGGFQINNSGNRIWVIKSNFSSYTTAADFKAYLQQQYAAGTPVTVWYVLATPTTETITVPSGLSGTEEGYLNQSGTPTPSTPIYPTANSVPYWQ